MKRNLNRPPPGVGSMFKCPACMGRGTVEDRRCSLCRGTGEVRWWQLGSPEQGAVWDQWERNNKEGS